MLCPSYYERGIVGQASTDSGFEHFADEESADGKMDLPAIERALAEVLDRFGLTDVAPEMLQELAEKDPDLFLVASLARLELDGGPPGYRKRSLRVFDTPAFLLELVRSEHFSTKELKDFCAKYVREDSLLDVKLARLMPGRGADSHHLETYFILRILEVLDEISPGPRLLMIIGHLTHHSEQHVASKAALLVGRRLQSREWIKRHISSTDSRVRANVTEALWGVNSALAAYTLRQCLRDEDNRVHGNAIVGLHMLGDQTIKWRIRNLIKDKRPVFRQTAAWVIGKVGNPEFAPLLEGLMVDPIDAVRKSAESALERLRGAAPSMIEPEFSPNIRMEAAPVCQTTDDTPIEPIVENDLATTTPDNILAYSEKPGKDADLGPAQKPSEPTFTLRLDGRYVTGA